MLRFLSINTRRGVFALTLAALAWPLTMPAATTTKKGTSKSSSTTPKSSTTKPTSKPAAKKPTAKKVPSNDEDKAPEPATESKVADKPKPAEPPKTTDDGGEKKATPAEGAKVHAPSATLEPSDLVEFAAQPPRVQQLIATALALTKLDLTYTYGSADPGRGGMDCSGTIYHVLRSEGFPDVPRDSSSQYVWVRKAGGFEAVVSTSAESFEFNALRPGDLMFWSGTYSVEREIPVTHVMLYLGREKKTKQRVMFGASDGRSYRGIQRWGVSVFDFKMPRVESGKETKVDFLGYGPIPGLRGGVGREVAIAEPPAPASETAKADAPAEPETPAPKKTAGASPTSKTGKSSAGSTKSGTKRPATDSKTTKKN